MADERIAWHPAFFEAIQLELLDYKDVLNFESEHQLTDEPLKVDVVIVKKKKETVIKKNIGQLFKGHTIIEFKSPLDYISINDFYKVYGYAMFYKSLHDIDIEDLAITFVQTRYPRQLIKHLEEIRKYTVTMPYDGLYYVHGDILPIQIIESKSLSEEDNIWLKSLNNGLSFYSTELILKKCSTLNRTERYSAYLNVVLEANPEILKEVLNMTLAEQKYEIVEIMAKKGWLDQYISEKEDEIKEKLEVELKKKTTIDLAKSMYNEGMNFEEISKWTKLPVEILKQELEKHS